MEELIAALVGGLGSILVWEGLLKPLRERQNVARALATEIGRNLQLVAAQSVARQANPTGIPRDFHLSKIALEAVGERLVDLPPEAVRHVVHSYAIVDYLNELVVIFAGMLDTYRGMGSDHPKLGVVRGEIDSTIDAFNRLLDRAFDEFNTTNRILHRLGERWAIRKQPFAEKSMEEIEAAVKRVLEKRAHNLGRG